MTMDTRTVVDLLLVLIVMQAVPVWWLQPVIALIGVPAALLAAMHRSG